MNEIATSAAARKPPTCSGGARVIVQLSEGTPTRDELIRNRPRVHLREDQKMQPGHHRAGHREELGHLPFQIPARELADVDQYRPLADSEPPTNLMPVTVVAFDQLHVHAAGDHAHPGVGAISEQLPANLLGEDDDAPGTGDGQPLDPFRQSKRGAASGPPTGVLELLRHQTSDVEDQLKSRQPTPQQPHRRRHVRAGVECIEPVAADQDRRAQRPTRVRRTP